MGPKKDTKETSSSTKKKGTTATASAKKTTKPVAISTSATSKDATKVVTKDRKEKIQTKALKAKQRVVRGDQLTRKRKIYTL